VKTRQRTCGSSTHSISTKDGVDEVITSTIGYEGNEYQILKRSRNGKWTIVYRGGGSGC